MTIDEITYAICNTGRFIILISKGLPDLHDFESEKACNLALSELKIL